MNNELIYDHEAMDALSRASDLLGCPTPEPGDVISHHDMGIQWLFRLLGPDGVAVTWLVVMEHDGAEDGFGSRANRVSVWRDA